MNIRSNDYGQLPDGSTAKLFLLSNGKGMEVDITNYGGIVTSIRIPDGSNKQGDVVLGFDSLEGYLGDHPYFGALIGRVANRIGGGMFGLDGKEYKLAQNNGNNHLHGGLKGFDKVLWDIISTEKTDKGVSLKLGYESADMEEGYPGKVSVEVEYKLSTTNELIITYSATTNSRTHVNLTNHSYFNLNNCRGNILDHELMIDADQVTELDEGSIPTGRILDVAGTCFDFRKTKAIGKDIAQIEPGYDINYVLNDYSGELKQIATVYHEQSGRSMEVFTTEPGVQLYTSNYIESIKGKEGIIYGKHAALCLETQHFPDAPNQPHFPSTILEPDEEYKTQTIYRFTW